jgi:hypothetical protein
MAKFLGVRVEWLHGQIVKIKMFSAENTQNISLTKPKFQKMSSGARFISRNKED